MPTSPTGANRDHPMRPVPPSELEAIEQALTRAPHEAGLIRLTPQARAQMGVTSTRWQTRKSLACLELLRAMPQLLPHFQEANPERWERLVGLRLFTAQCRRALGPLRKAAWGASTVLLGRITEHCDRIEDSLLGQANAPQASDELRRRLRSKFDDPASLRRIFDETTEQRKARRLKRAAVRATAEEQARALVARERGADQIRHSPLL